jgi:hypothetical protein
MQLTGAHRIKDPSADGWYFIREFVPFEKEFSLFTAVNDMHVSVKYNSPYRHIIENKTCEVDHTPPPQ